MNPPLYKIGDSVYLSESAELGFLESYRVDSISYDKDSEQWMYGAIIRMGGPETATVIDSYNLKKTSILQFIESQVVDACTAIGIAIQRLTRDLTKLYANRGALASVQEGYNESSPKYSPGNNIYVRESAAIGFIETFKISNIKQDPATNAWLYQITRSDVNASFQKDLWYREDELIGIHEAIELATLKCKARLDEMTALQASLCSN